MYIYIIYMCIYIYIYFCRKNVINTNCISIDDPFLLNKKKWVSYQIYKAKPKNEETPSSLVTTLSFFFLLRFRNCVLDHRIMVRLGSITLFCDQGRKSESLEEARKIM